MNSLPLVMFSNNNIFVHHSLFVAIVRKYVSHAACKHAGFSFDSNCINRKFNFFNKGITRNLSAHYPIAFLSLMLFVYMLTGLFQIIEQPSWLLMDSVACLYLFLNLSIHLNIWFWLVLDPLSPMLIHHCSFGLAQTEPEWGQLTCLWLSKHWQTNTNKSIITDRNRTQCQLTVPKLIATWCKVTYQTMRKE